VTLISVAVLVKEGSRQLSLTINTIFTFSSGR